MYGMIVMTETLQIGASSLMFIAGGKEDSGSTNCLTSSGIGKALTTSSCFRFNQGQGFRYSESTGQLSSGIHSLSMEAKMTTRNEDIGQCVTYDNSLKSSKMMNCDVENGYQRWIYLNEEFYLSTNKHITLKVSGFDRWTQGGGIPHLPKAIVLQGSQILHSPLCLEDKGKGVPVMLAYCKDSPIQRWTMSDNTIQNESTGRCISQTENIKYGASVEHIYSLDCKIFDYYDTTKYWDYKDGSLYVHSDEEYLIESDGIGGVRRVFIPNERRRGLNQRWLVGSKLYSDYHLSTNSIRIRNEAAHPVECSLSQLSPLYWGGEGHFSRSLNMYMYHLPTQYCF